MPLGPFDKFKKKEEPLKTESPADLPNDETKEVPAGTPPVPGPFFEKPPVETGPFPSKTRYEVLLDEMRKRWQERTADFAQKEDHLLIMKRAARILNTETWRHGIHMMAQKFSRILQEYENPGQVSPEKFDDACVDLGNFSLLTAEAHGRSRG